MAKLKLVALPIAPNVRKARELTGQTQLALAHAIGMKGKDAGAYISRIESGSVCPGLDVLQRIAAALGVSLETLLKK